jgi:hypothetical protein
MNAISWSGQADDRNGSHIPDGRSDRPDDRGETSMKALTALGLLAALAASPAFAASPQADQNAAPNRGSPGARHQRTELQKTTMACRELQAQFDKALRGASGAGVEPSKRLRADGARDCRNGDPGKGAAELRKALTDIDVKPKT